MNFVNIKLNLNKLDGWMDGWMDGIILGEGDAAV